MALALGPYTVETLEQLPQDGNRYELLDGELIVTNSPIPRHQILVQRLSVALYHYVTDNRFGGGTGGPPPQKSEDLTTD